MASLLSPARNVPFLSPDEERTGRDGVDYLHGLGHREIAFLSSPRRAHAVAARAAGYRRRMNELGLRPRVVLSPDPAGRKGRLPTALFCHNDWLAAQAIARLRAAGTAIPGDVSVLGVDDSPTLSALCPDPDARARRGAPQALRRAAPRGRRVVDGKTELEMPLYPYPARAGWDAAASRFVPVAGPRGGVERVAARFRPPAAE